MRIIVGSDHFGYVLKETVKAHLAERGLDVIDIGCAGESDEVDYPDVAVSLAGRIASGEFERGVLICGTGIGMAMVANKIPGVRAACCHDPYSAERARKSNDAQVITFGAQIVGPAVTCSLLDHWLESEFGGGRSLPKVEKIKQLDAQAAAALTLAAGSQNSSAFPAEEVAR
jgi:ribose 5-phosphate isomerase B